uniref:Large ribosomal subunit protein uL16m n=1 Tax=Daucus carota subsp. sativus TaxID=79200 RepID=I1TIA9_DAUCS|nr:ribosomal protein L16 [Daucus carota subsp. sativus]AEY81139.1 ribosomal protein L16 [Daucus carota subsp. sativus]
MGKSSRRSPYYRETYRSQNGRGKGNPTGWIARVSTGQILFEMDGVSLSNARQAATLAAHKPCSSTKFVQWS